MATTMRIKGRDPTIADRMTMLGKPSSGFDYMRLALSVIILCWHSLLVTHGLPWANVAMSMPEGVIIRLVLPMFFTLSGFLVAGSLERNPSIPTFILFRVLRIVPALAVEISLSALLIGSATTTLALGAYFTDPMFGHYFLNIMGWIHFNLPGVFATNPDDTVNRSLWTIPSELECYLFLIVVALIGAYARKYRLLIAVVAVYAGYVCFRIIFHGATPGFQPGSGLVLSRLLLFYFMGGVVCFRLRDRIPFNAILFGISLVTAIATLLFDQTIWLSIPAVVYCTVYLGMLNPAKIGFLKRGDYSYGIYLYAYPIQQVYVFLLPHAPWYANLALALPTTAAFSVFSWHAIEKPALQLKRYFGRRPTMERVNA